MGHVKGKVPASTLGSRHVIAQSLPPSDCEVPSSSTNSSTRDGRYIYLAQYRLLRKDLETQFGPDVFEAKAHVQITVTTIDRCGGLEFDIVYAAFSRSDGLGFLIDEIASTSRTASR
ncbi:hypothetical protein DdX_16850 [Ditylenchus destructor]|uniref:Uncharacterized protein n=1 Tax=Ditylenchus destructor TaxID=166010 RepID=A0AAD4MMP9_9BILA|nr:hypothetical protein DdX_16850 [Ditylenchus destructor]